MESAARLDWQTSTSRTIKQNPFLLGVSTMMRHCLALILLSFMAVPASADWSATTEAAKESVKQPKIAAALAAAMLRQSHPVKGRIRV